MNLLNKSQLFSNLDSRLVQHDKIKFQTMIHDKKALLLLAIMAIIQIKGNSQSFPYAQTPDWESTPGGYISTGLGLADINRAFGIFYLRIVLHGHGDGVTQSQ